MLTIILLLFSSTGRSDFLNLMEELEHFHILEAFFLLKATIKKVHPLDVSLVFHLRFSFVVCTLTLGTRSVHAQIKKMLLKRRSYLHQPARKFHAPSRTAPSSSWTLSSLLPMSLTANHLHFIPTANCTTIRTFANKSDFILKGDHIQCNYGHSSISYTSSVDNKKEWSQRGHVQSHPFPWEVVLHSAVSPSRLGQQARGILSAFGLLQEIANQLENASLTMNKVQFAKLAQSGEALPKVVLVEIAALSLLWI